MTVHVIPIWVKSPYDCLEISTVSNSGKYRELSPFVLGPIDTYLPNVRSENFENLWQYSKIYKEHFSIDEDLILPVWYKWREAGWANPRAVRYPMGKGIKPEFSYWDGNRLGYIEARKMIYAPIYAKYVIKTDSYARLKALYSTRVEITLKDYDAYDHLVMGMSLIDVINNPKRKMGHAFVLAMLLQGVLEECLR